MRSVQVIEQSAEQTTRAEHVIGVDESGDVTGPSPFALVVVRCPREKSETLAELLVENDLAPWLGKSKTLVENTSQSERQRRVRNFLKSLTGTEISWRAAVGYPEASIHHKAAAVCVLAKKTITGVPESRGDSILLPDGAPSMYGNRQEHLRAQAAQIFDGPFQAHFGEMYITGLPKADLTYPEVTAADYLAGYLREAVQEGRQAEDLPPEVMRFSHDWREPRAAPLPYYTIRGVTGEYGPVSRTRIAAWIKGRHPEGEPHDISSQWENTVRMLESERLQRYLLEELLP